MLDDFLLQQMFLFLHLSKTTQLTVGFNTKIVWFSVLSIIRQILIIEVINSNLNHYVLGENLELQGNIFMKSKTFIKKKKQKKKLIF